MENETQNEGVRNTEETNAPKKDGKIGPTIGSIIIIVIIILGGLYFIDTIRQTNTDTETRNATETSDISADLENTDIESLDADLAEIEMEINASLNN